MSQEINQTAQFNRQILLTEVGIEGQRKLSNAKVLIVGAGGLGCPVALYLAVAGVGKLGLVDADSVSISNIHRQILFGVDDVGTAKVEVAKRELKRRNPAVIVETYQTFLNRDNAIDIASAYDLIVDCSDNFPARYLINDLGVLLKKTIIFASIFQFEGQLSVFGTEDGPCYRCLYPQPPKPGEVPNCSEAGVIGVLPGIMGLYQANEAIKLILQIGEPLIGQLAMFDALTSDWQAFAIAKRHDCPVCGNNPSVHELIDYNHFCGIPEKIITADAIRPESLRQFIEQHSAVIIDVRTSNEQATGILDNALCIPIKELANRLSELEAFKNTAIVVTCQKGPRSEQAIEILSEHGFNKLYQLEGGMEAVANYSAVQ